MAAKRAECKLCGIPSELVESHIIPKFVFQWMKQTGMQFLRSGKSPNIRVQDGIKEYLFCRKCEQIFGTSEKWFSEKVFHPYLANQERVFLYNELLSKFIVSLLWRLLLKSNLDEEYQNFPLKKEMLEALEEWRDFLLHNRVPTKYNDLHLFLNPEEWGGVQPNPYVSRYFSRDVDGHIIYLPEEGWIYVKFARFMFFGRLKGSIKSFRNTRINFTSGNTLLGNFIDDPDISSYLVNRAELVYAFFKEHLSKKQSDLITNFAITNSEKIQKTDMGKRISQDFTAKINPYNFVPSFNYTCDCCGTQLSEPDGIILRTFEIIRSKEFFKKQFENLQLEINEEHLKVRLEYFKQISSQTTPWVVCGKCDYMFEYDPVEAKSFMVEWINFKGDYVPPSPIISEII